ncbi:MAG TPA: arylsulfotransferase family protein [Dongiaceae bacterium]|nr:arylsulfotransferase family protein [Dongiaceae bacterium]
MWWQRTIRSVSDSPKIGEQSGLDAYLSKTVPVWFVAALVLFFTCAIVAFGWYVKRSVYLDDHSPVARGAIAVASFPTDVKKVFKELALRQSGYHADYRYVQAHPDTTDFSGFSPVGSQLKTAIEGLVVRKGPGVPERGWRVIVGGFRIDGSVEDAAVLLSPDLEIVRYWLLAKDSATSADPPSANLTAGLTLLKDGSVIIDSAGSGLRRLDSCSRPIWSIEGGYNHAVTLDDTETTVWTFRHDDAADRAEADKIVQIAVADGKIVREFSVADVIAANPEIDVLELRRYHEAEAHENLRGKPGVWLTDPFHLNDADPLPRDLADRFPMFSAGDLAISARELNLIFVLDPRTLAIKWWRVGDTIRQHDVDWTADGRLSIFNNRMARDYSEIVEIDPATSVKTVVVGHEDVNFYTRVAGMHQRLPGGDILIVSKYQGRVIEVAPNRDKALEFYSLLSERPIVAILSEAAFLPEPALDIAAMPCGKP